jgi:hypothetical protein
MKRFVILLSLLMASSAFADTTAIRRVLFNGGVEHQEVNLNTEETRTEYRTVRVPATCYRREVRRVCDRRTPPVCRQVCRQGNCRRVCSPPRRICRDEVRNIPYSCMRMERRAFQVHDYYVETNVQFEFNNSDVMNDANEEFAIRMTGELASLKVRSSKNYVIVLDKQSRRESRGAGVKYVNLVYKINFIPSSGTSRVLENGIRNVSLRNGIVNFTLGAGFNLNNFTQQVRVFKNRRLGTDRLLLNKMLTANDANVQSTASATTISIDLKTLGVQVPSKVRIILDTKYKIDVNTVLNRNEVKLDASANWVFR